MKTAYKAERIFLENDVLRNAYLIVSDGKFVAYQTEEPDDVNKIIDYSDAWLAPGLVDTHIHGFAGYDVMDASSEAIHAMTEGLPSTGVTSFLATTLTSSVELTDKAVSVVAQEVDKTQGAKIQGIFLEGPFFTEEHKGAQNPNYFMPPNIDVLKQWIESSNHLVKKASLAPEYPETKDFIAYAKSQGVKVSLAHSSATYEEAVKAVDQGASIFIHTFNGMSGLHHREPGLVGAAMTLQNTFAELIADGHHVAPSAIRALVNARSTDNTLLITDCMRAGGLPNGNYSLGEFPVVVKDGAARLENGSLAGSVLQLKDGVKNIVNWNIATVHEAINMASLVPAKSVGIENQCGSIKIDRPADFIVLDNNLNLQATYIDGEKYYQA